MKASSDESLRHDHKGIADESTVKEAAQLMLQRRISAFLVVDGSGKLVGVASEGDLMRRAELGI